MNEKTARQIEEMKKQTIGVEVEMNNITKRESRKDSRRLLRNGKIPEHSKPQRILHLVSMGCRRQRVEIPKGCQHSRTRHRKVRTGNPDTHLQRH